MSEIDLQIQPGPCVGCGATDYPLSMGGPRLCPACDIHPPQERALALGIENRRLRAELQGIYEAVDHSDAALYNAVKQSKVRVLGHP